VVSPYVITDQNRTVTLVVRYGLPVLILVFYLTAVRHFDYTPDSTYAVAQVAQNVEHWLMFAGPAALVETSSPSPLWIFFQAAGIRASIDVILFAKVFGIFFCCAVLMLGYLTAFEVTDDRLLAFCAAFVLATSVWLEYLAPTGSALPAAVALTLASVFFLLRNEYLLASLFAGLTTMVLWEGALLMVLLLADLLLNSVVRRRAYRVAATSGVVFAVVVVPWVVYARLHGEPVIPALVPLGSAPAYGVFGSVSVVLLLVLASGGVGLSLRGSDGWIHVRTHAAPIAWTALMLGAGLAGSWERSVLATPFLVLWAFSGLQRGLRAVKREGALYLSAFALAAVMLLVNQITYLGTVRPAVQESVETSRSLAPIASWLKSTIGDSVSVASEHAGELAYRSGRTVEQLREGETPSSAIVITSREDLRGYTRQFILSQDSLALPASSRTRLSIWVKQP